MFFHAQRGHGVAFHLVRWFLRLHKGSFDLCTLIRALYFLCGGIGTSGLLQKQAFISVEEKLPGCATNKCSLEFCFFPHYLSTNGQHLKRARKSKFSHKGTLGAALSARCNQQRSSSSLQAVTSHSGSRGLVCFAETAPDLWQKVLFLQNKSHSSGPHVCLSLGATSGTETYLVVMLPPEF